MERQDQFNKSTMDNIQELKNSIGRIESHLNIREQGTFPSQPQPNPRPQGQSNSANESNGQMRQVQAVTTLRSGRLIERDIPEIPPQVEEVSKDSTSEVEGEQITAEEEPKETETIYKPVAPFPQRLRPPVNLNNNAEIFELFKHVKINIPLLDAIKQIPSNAKFLKDLCTIKRKHNINNKAFLTEQVSSIIQHKYPPKYKDLGCPTISCVIGNFRVDRALLDLGASVNLLPYSVYKQLGLSELKPTSVTLQLADRSVKIPRGVVEDVLVQVDKFCFPVDFIVLDTHPVMSPETQIPVILGRPFLATSNAFINCRNGVIKLSFGNMTLELNIFNICKQPGEDDEIEEVNFIDTIVE